MKKFISLALALIMVFALSVSVFAEEVVFSIDATQGQDTENAVLADGFALASTQGDAYCRVSTNWVGGGAVWNGLIAAFSTEGAVLRVTYTGTINDVVLQSEKGNYEILPKMTTAEVDGKTVGTISCADILASAPIATGGDFGGWANFMFDYAEGATVYAIEVVTGADAPAAEEPADVEPVEEEPTVEEPVEETPAEEEPAETGIVLCLLPMAAAAAAVVISKRR